MSWLEDYMGNTGAYFHYTMACGNDNLMGHARQLSRVPDGGVTVLLLGMAVVGMGLVGRKLRG